MRDYCPHCGQRSFHWPGCFFELAGSEIIARLTNRGMPIDQARQAVLLRDGGREDRQRLSEMLAA